MEVVWRGPCYISKLSTYIRVIFYYIDEQHERTRVSHPETDEKTFRFIPTILQSFFLSQTDSNSRDLKCMYATFINEVGGGACKLPLMLF